MTCLSCPSMWKINRSGNHHRVTEVLKRATSLSPDHFDNIWSPFCDFLCRSSLGDCGSSSLTDAAQDRKYHRCMLCFGNLGTRDSPHYQSLVIVESSRLKKNSEIIKFKLWLNTTMPTKPSCRVSCLLFFNTSGVITPPLPWGVSSNASPVFQRRNFS